MALTKQQREALLLNTKTYHPEDLSFVEFSLNILEQRNLEEHNKQKEIEYGAAIHAGIDYMIREFVEKQLLNSKLLTESVIKTNQKAPINQTTDQLNRDRDDEFNKFKKNMIELISKNGKEVFPIKMQIKTEEKSTTNISNAGISNVRFKITGIKFDANGNIASMSFTIGATFQNTPKGQQQISIFKQEIEDQFKQTYIKDPRKKLLSDIRKKRNETLKNDQDYREKINELDNNKLFKDLEKREIDKVLNSHNKFSFSDEPNKEDSSKIDVTGNFDISSPQEMEQGLLTSVSKIRKLLKNIPTPESKKKIKEKVMKYKVGKYNDEKFEKDYKQIIEIFFISSKTTTAVTEKYSPNEHLISSYAQYSSTYIKNYCHNKDNTLTIYSVTNFASVSVENIANFVDKDPAKNIFNDLMTCKKI